MPIPYLAVAGSGLLLNSLLGGAQANMQRQQQIQQHNQELLRYNQMRALLDPSWMARRQAAELRTAMNGPAFSLARQQANMAGSRAASAATSALGRQGVGRSALGAGQAGLAQGLGGQAMAGLYAQADQRSHAQALEARNASLGLLASQPIKPGGAGFGMGMLQGLGASLPSVLAPFADPLNEWQGGWGGNFIRRK